jgi:hypothetical protein
MKIIQEFLDRGNHLYHASKTSGIKVLEPQSHKLAEKPVVFATPNALFAISMIHGTNGDIAVGYFSDSDTGYRDFVIDELKPNKFQLIKNPGSLYILPTKGFIKTPHLMREEVISYKSVKIIKEIKIRNVYEYLMKAKGVRLVKYADISDDWDRRGKNMNPKMGI